VSGNKVLVAGVGNIFLGDDGFGVEVAQRLAGQPMPAGVKVTDFGIRGMHLAYELLDGYDAVVLVDAVGNGDPPGTLTVLEPEYDAEMSSDEGRVGVLNAHGMEPAAVLGLLSSLGGEVGRVVVVGCEAGTFEEQIGLSPAVEGAVDQAVQIVKELVAEMATQGKENATS
jgi:hydrogenase maturation protease